MIIYSTLKIGDHHINHCEDNLFIGDIGDDIILCAVMDGCTMATDSYFASTLVGKILRKITIKKSYTQHSPLNSSIEDIDSLLKSILEELFKELLFVKHQLLLDRNELLTTLLLLILDKKSNHGAVLVIGDGLVAINGNLTDFDQDNKPDYLGFHLSDDFESWFYNQKQKLFFDKIEDISIATDGIFTFAPYKSQDNTNIINALEYLITDTTDINKEDMLNFKTKRLEHTFGLKPTDDLAIIRIINSL